MKHRTIHYTFSSNWSPSLATIKKYAEVLGYHLEIRLVRNK